MPSSHAQFMALTGYILSYYYSHAAPSYQRFRAVLLGLGAVAATLAVSFSRWYLEYHYPSQIAAGWLAGLVLGHIFSVLAVKICGSRQ
jgi:membrane-associated phospholipid phosphatase